MACKPEFCIGQLCLGFYTKKTTYIWSIILFVLFILFLLMLAYVVLVVFFPETAEKVKRLFSGNGHESDTDDGRKKKNKNKTKDKDKEKEKERKKAKDKETSDDSDKGRASQKSTEKGKRSRDGSQRRSESKKRSNDESSSSDEESRKKRKKHSGRSRAGGLDSTNLSQSKQPPDEGSAHPERSFDKINENESRDKISLNITTDGKHNHSIEILNLKESPSQKSLSSNKEVSKHRTDSLPKSKHSSQTKQMANEDSANIEQSFDWFDYDESKDKTSLINNKDNKDKHSTKEHISEKSPPHNSRSLSKDIPKHRIDSGQSMTNASLLSFDSKVIGSVHSNSVNHGRRSTLRNPQAEKLSNNANDTNKGYDLGESSSKSLPPQSYIRFNFDSYKKTNTK